VRELKCKGLTERHALEVVAMSASALRYVVRSEGNDALRTAILVLAHRHTRHGLRMIHLKLQQAS
jgi:putative transposase